MQLIISQASIVYILLYIFQLIIVYVRDFLDTLKLSLQSMKKIVTFCFFYRLRNNYIYRHLYYHSLQLYVDFYYLLFFYLKISPLGGKPYCIWFYCFHPFTLLCRRVCVSTLEHITSLILICNETILFKSETID